jgi:hypothetical protein
MLYSYLSSLFCVCNMYADSIDLFRFHSYSIFRRNIKIILSTAAWISRYYHTHLQPFELRNVFHLPHWFHYVTHFYLEANRQNLLK